jgi:hypothetical protein
MFILFFFSITIFYYYVHNLQSQINELKKYSSSHKSMLHDFHQELHSFHQELHTKITFCNDIIKSFENIIQSFEDKIETLRKNSISVSNDLSLRIQNFESRFLFTSPNSFHLYDSFFSQSNTFHYDLILKYTEITPQHLVQMMDYYNMKRTLEDIWKELIHKQHYFKVNYNGEDRDYFLIYNSYLYKNKNIEDIYKQYDHTKLLAKKIDTNIVPFAKKFCNIQYNFINGYKNKENIKTVFLQGDEFMKQFNIIKFE